MVRHCLSLQLIEYDPVAGRKSGARTRVNPHPSRHRYHAGAHFFAPIPTSDHHVEQAASLLDRLAGQGLDENKLAARSTEFAMTSSDSDVFSLGKFLGGLAVGVVLTYAYTRYRWEMPAVVQLPATVTSSVISATADSDLYNWDLPFEVRQRAAAIILGQNPDRFVELDNATDHVLMYEMQRQRAVRLAMIAKQKFSAYQVALDKPALRERLERKYGTTESEQLKRQMLADDIAGDAILTGYLRDRFPDVSRDKRVDLILNVGQNGLIPPPRQVATEVDLSLPR